MNENCIYNRYMLLEQDENLDLGYLTWESLGTFGNDPSCPFSSFIPI